MAGEEAEGYAYNRAWTWERRGWVESWYVHGRPTGCGDWSVKECMTYRTDRSVPYSIYMTTRYSNTILDYLGALHTDVVLFYLFFLLHHIP